MIRRRVVGGLLAVGLSAGCGGGHGARPYAFVALGDSETMGYGVPDPGRQGWPALLGATLPAGTQLTNLGRRGETAAQGLTEELPDAPHRADLWTVWFGINDLLEGVSPAAFSVDLRRLVAAAPAHARVLVGNVPPLDLVPAYLSCRTTPPGPHCSAALAKVADPAALRSQIAAYNTAIAAVATASGATLVDVHTAFAQAPVTADLYSTVDEFHPGVGGYLLLEKTFSAALRR